MMPRRQQALQVRVNAAELAANRPHPRHLSNGEEYEYRRPKTDAKDQIVCNEPSHIANFTKGLPHNPETGLLLNTIDYQQFVLGIQSGDPEDYRRTPLGPGEPPLVPGCLSPELITCHTDNRNQIWQSQIAQGKKGKDGRHGADVRAWESAGAGLVFDLEGPDAQAVTMPPAPTLDSVELSAEMAEVYLQALLRDVHFSQLRDPSFGEQFSTPSSQFCQQCPPQVKIDEAMQILCDVKVDNRNWFASDCCELTEQERNRHRSQVDLQQIFRGITPGEDQGPYLSQFLLIGNEALIDGVFGIDRSYISYGSIRIDQRVRLATPCKDYMTTFEAWVDVQNGADVRGEETYIAPDSSQCREFPAYRLITTPRDLATYVHYDALYEAYLNACLILLGMEVPFDPGIPFQQPDVADKQQGFAHFGAPQILTLVCEVATRALKAVRYQKFNVHRRLRPEAVGGLIDRYKQGVAPEALKPLQKLVTALDGDLLNRVAAHNDCQNNQHSDRQNDSSGQSSRYLLPMAFPEGSPMHPSYGAGHATVAGACVTILKAFFDHGWELKLGRTETGQYCAYEPNADGSGLQQITLDKPLTVEGELNKLAANISIGRNWAGVHYFTDYIESIRMGEQIAIGILEEQKLTYGENFTMTVPLFDGGTVRI